MKTKLSLASLALLLSLTTVAAAQPGFISTVADTGTCCFNGDDILATTAQLNLPTSIFVDKLGNIFIADFFSHRVRKVDSVTGLISTVAGTGACCYNGDGIEAKIAKLARPFYVYVDGAGNLFISDRDNRRVRRVDAATGLISTVAGTGAIGFNGDGILATSARISEPSGVFVDESGNLFISDRGDHRVRKVDDATDLISTVAGTGVLGFNGDGILATSAQLSAPSGIFVDSFGNLFIADSGNHRVRKVDSATGLISTVAGTGALGFSGDGILATTSRLSHPNDVFVDGSGSLLIADGDNHRVRKVDGATGFISTVVGTGTFGFNGDGIPATPARVARPFGVHVDEAGNLFIADAQNRRVRKVEANEVNTGTRNISELPSGYVLEAAYPNPFNHATNIRFSVPEASPVKLVVFDVLGRQVRVLVDGVRAVGIHEVLFKAGDLPSGTYLYRLETRRGSFVQMMQLVK